MFCGLEKISFCDTFIIIIIIIIIIIMAFSFAGMNAGLHTSTLGIESGK